jgi:DNA-binding CsgD family transcriptional regulator
LTALGQVLVRRGAPEAANVLDEALALAELNGQLMRLGPVRAARAEAALLAGDVARAREETEAVREHVFSHGDRWLRSEVAWLLWQAGDGDVPTDNLAEPYALQIAGDYAGAAAIWNELGCPYEEARALAASDVPDAVRLAVAAFERLGAQPAIRQAIQRLRALGVRDLPPVRRGPLAATRANPAGLTRRETEVLSLLAEGLSTAEIARRLYLTPKTVRYYVSAILGKLGVETRGEAIGAAAKLGLVPS